MLNRWSRVGLLLLALALLLPAGCGSLKRDALEGDSQLAAVVEGRHALPLSKLLLDDLQPVIYTPQQEARFYVQMTVSDSLGVVSRWQQVLLLGTLDGQDSVSARIRRMLSSELREGVRNGDYRLIKRNDLWARGQTVVVVVAPTADELVGWVRQHGERIYRTFADERRARLKKQLYSINEQEKLADSLRSAHGWRLRIPHDFGLVSSQRDPAFVRLVRRYPDRLMTVAWRQGKADELSVESLLEWRDSLGVHFADSVRVNRHELQADTVQIAGREAVKLVGLWETYGVTGGGPFVAYLLHDQGTLYLLDGQIYAPDRSKMHFVRQFEVILSTFEP